MTHFASQEQALRWMFGHLVAYLRGDSKPEPVATFADGAAVLRAIDALAASSEDGKWQEIPRPS